MEKDGVIAPAQNIKTMETDTTKTRCKETVQTPGMMRYHRCTRNAVRDGFCNQHHPDSVKKRDEKANALYQEKLKLSPWSRLTVTSKKLAIARAGLQRLARLGNEPNLGNSIGNTIAIETLTAIDNEQ